MDGMCFWCSKNAVGEFFGTALCSEHFEIEEAMFLADCGMYFGV